MTLEEMSRRAEEFGARLAAIKAEVDPPPWGWYPFQMLPGSVQGLDRLLSGEPRRLLEDGTARIADVGGADGDLAFFLESLGFEVHLYEGGPGSGEGSVRELRQFNARRLKEALGSNLEVHGIDLDHETSLAHQYDLVVSFGVLYHLQNPFVMMQTLARHARYGVISTKVARYLPVPGGILRRRIDMSELPVAYLLETQHRKGDPTNYWVFSEAGLRRLVERAGWSVLDYMVLGDPNSDPTSPPPGGRGWCLLQSESLDGTPSERQFAEFETWARQALSES